MEDLLEYKIFVFDLDNTIILKKVDILYASDYKSKIIKFLSLLKNKGKFIYIASHNREPDEVLYCHNIPLYLFDGIIGERKILSKHINKIEEYTNKKDMILEILSKHKNLSKEDLVFFDDIEYNIQQVESINVRSILVDRYKGILI